MGEIDVAYLLELDQDDQPEEMHMSWDKHNTQKRVEQMRRQVDGARERYTDMSVLNALDEIDEAIDTFEAAAAGSEES